MDALILLRVLSTSLHFPMPCLTYEEVEINLDMDSDENPGAWLSKGEEDIILLDVSDNNRSRNDCHLDSRIDVFVSLQSLRARRSGISHVQWETFYRFNELVILDLSGNELAIAMLEYVPINTREIDLSKNKLVSLIETPCNDEGNPSEPVIVLPNLTRLDVSENQLTKLPKSMEVPGLQSFIFGHNKITDLSLAATDIIAQSCRSLTTLEGPNNNLCTLPDLSRCPKLTSIDLRDNSLYEVPTISNAVIRLNLMNNSISSITDIFGDNQLGTDTYRSSLKELRLRGNKLRSLDEEVFKCMTNVTLIDAGQNHLKDVPNILGFLPQLRSLQLDGNAIRAIRNPLLNDPSALKNFLRKRGPPPRGEGYLHDESSEYDSVPSTTPIPTNNAAKSLINSALVGTFTLDLSDEGLDSLPIEVGNELLLSNPSSGRDGDNGFVGERIHKLDVSNNKLSSLDDWLTAVPNITSLEASKNLIEFLPKFIGDVPLVELLISRNKLSSSALAATLIEGTASVLAANLTYLDLSGNRLKWMPTALSTLPVLSDLILTNNTITTLASESHDEGIKSGWPVEGFKSLENLNLADNKISDLGNLPHCLATNCPAMKFLSLRNNELHFIPPILGLIETLTNIDLRGNPQRGIRMNVLERKAGDILSYLRGRIDDQDRVAVKTKSSSSDCNDNGKTSLSVIEANERIEGLRSSIQDITLQLNNVYITEAEKGAMKKKLHMNKANLIQEERCLRHAINGCS